MFDLQTQRLQKQLENDKLIMDSIDKAESSPTTYINQGPVLMNLQETSEILNFKLLNQQNHEIQKKKYCQEKCQQDSSCLAKCNDFWNQSTSFGLNYFQNLYKYTYVPAYTAEEGDQ